MYFITVFFSLIGDARWPWTKRPKWVKGCFIFYFLNMFVAKFGLKLSKYNVLSGCFHAGRCRRNRVPRNTGFCWQVCKFCMSHVRWTCLLLSVMFLCTSMLFYCHTTGGAWRAGRGGTYWTYRWTCECFFRFLSLPSSQFTQLFSDLLFCCLHIE